MFKVRMLVQIHKALQTGKNWNLRLKCLQVWQVLCLNPFCLQKNKIIFFKKKTDKVLQ